MIVIMETIRVGPVRTGTAKLNRSVIHFLYKIRISLSQFYAYIFRYCISHFIR